VLAWVSAVDAEMLRSRATAFPNFRLLRNQDGFFFILGSFLALLGQAETAEATNEFSAFVPNSGTVDVFIQDSGDVVNRGKSLIAS
jgi:hypothetical protein